MEEEEVGRDEVGGEKQLGRVLTLEEGRRQ